MLVSPMVCYYPHEDIFNFHHVSLCKIAEIQEVLSREAVFGNVADFISCLNVANPQLSTELTTGRMEVCETFPFHSLDTDVRCVARDRESHGTYGLEIVSFHLICCLEAGDTSSAFRRMQHRRNVWKWRRAQLILFLDRCEVTHRPWMLYEHAIGELLQYVSLQGTGARREVGVRRVGLRVREKTSFWNAGREWGREAARIKGGG